MSVFGCRAISSKPTTFSSRTLPTNCSDLFQDHFQGAESEPAGVPPTAHEHPTHRGAALGTSNLANLSANSRGGTFGKSGVDGGLEWNPTTAPPRLIRRYHSHCLG